MVKLSAITSTTVYPANHDAHSGSRKSSRKKMRLYDSFFGCAIGDGYHARLYAAGMSQNKIIVAYLIMTVQPKIIAD